MRYRVKLVFLMSNGTQQVDFIHIEATTGDEAARVAHRSAKTESVFFADHEKAVRQVTVNGVEADPLGTDAEIEPTDPHFDVPPTPTAPVEEEARAEREYYERTTEEQSDGKAKRKPASK